MKVTVTISVHLKSGMIKRRSERVLTRRVLLYSAIRVIKIFVTYSCTYTNISYSFYRLFENTVRSMMVQD